MADQERVSFFIDGFNLYYSLIERCAQLKTYRWLDVQALCEKLITKKQVIAAIWYFTARIKVPHAKARRQELYLRALETRPLVRMGKQGVYRSRPWTCSNCQNSLMIPKEKGTDVNITCAMLTEAVNDNYDVGVLVSGDNDFAGAIDAVKSLFPQKRMGAFFPTGTRFPTDLRVAADFHKNIESKDIRHSLLPVEIQLPSGAVLTPPDGWTPPREQSAPAPHLYAITNQPTAAGYLRVDWKSEYEARVLAAGGWAKFEGRVDQAYHDTPLSCLRQLAADFREISPPFDCFVGAEADVLATDGTLNCDESTKRELDLDYLLASVHLSPKTIESVSDYVTDSS